MTNLFLLKINPDRMLVHLVPILSPEKEFGFNSLPGDGGQSEAILLAYPFDHCCTFQVPDKNKLEKDLVNSNSS